jgi:hypothetical protein
LCCAGKVLPFWDASSVLGRSPFSGRLSVLGQSPFLGRLPNLSLFGTLNLSRTRMFNSGNFFTILGRAIAFLFGIMEFYIFDKLLAVPTAQVARKLAPLAFGTGLSLLGALPPNPHLLHIFSSSHSFLRSLILTFIFTQSHPHIHFYAVSSLHNLMSHILSIAAIVSIHLALLTFLFWLPFPRLLKLTVPLLLSLTFSISISWTRQSILHLYL